MPAEEPADPSLPGAPSPRRTCLPLAAATLALFVLMILGTLVIENVFDVLPQHLPVGPRERSVFVQAADVAAVSSSFQHIRHRAGLNSQIEYLLSVNYIAGDKFRNG